MTVRTKYAVSQESKIPSITPEFGLVLMDLSLEPIGLDRGGAAILNSGGQQPLCLPKEILYEIGKRKPKDLVPLKTHLSVGEKEYTCGAYLLEACNGSETKPMVALRFQRVASASQAVKELGATYRLTDREQEVLRGVSSGLGNKQLAERMNLSPNTVKIFVHTIMIKMRVKTRAAIVAMILNQETTENRAPMPHATLEAKRLAG